MDRGILLGIIGGAAVFIIILSFVIYSHSSFDQRLIDQVEEGVPAEQLIPQIDNETANMQYTAKTRLEKVVMDKKYWGHGDLAKSDDYKTFIESYQSELRIIGDYENARKKYARRETTRREFLWQIKTCKEFYDLLKY